MHKTQALCALAALFAVPTVAHAQTISTTTSNNGSGGIFLSLTPTTTSLTFNGFSTYYGSATGTPVNVEVWTRPGAYTGFTTANTGWTLAETLTTTSMGTTTLAPATLTTPISVPVGGPTSIYLHSITAGGGIRYTGTNASPPQQTWSNTDVTLFSDISRTGAVAFAGTQFSPRTFAGDVMYGVVPVPEPATCLGAAAIVGLAAATVRRRLRPNPGVEWSGVLA